MNFLRIALMGVLLCAATPRTHADPLGVYLGGSVGEGEVRLHQFLAATSVDFEQHHGGWTVNAGLRPLSLLGLEGEFIDFGHPSGSYLVGGSIAALDRRMRASALVGLFYMPLPVPLLDVYFKGGLARLEQSGGGTGACASTPGCPGLFSLSRNDTRPIYGAGLQLSVSRIALRAEYQRISANSGDPDLFSLGITWGF